MSGEMEQVREAALGMLNGCGLRLSSAERNSLKVLDYGLGDVRREGLQNITLVCTERIEIKIQILLPNQSVPQHVHPPYHGNPGKEETIRVVHGELRLYLDGADTMRVGVPPAGKEEYYTLRNERVLGAGQQWTIEPGIEHWFQGGGEGAVALSFYTRADNTHNSYADPQASFPTGTPAAGG